MIGIGVESDNLNSLENLKIWSWSAYQIIANNIKNKSLYSDKCRTIFISSSIPSPGAFGTSRKPLLILSGSERIG